LNPLHNTLKVGDVVRIEHTPYSSFTVEISKIAGNITDEEGVVTKETV
jgi:hypothetical protein